MEMALPLQWPLGCKVATTNSSRFRVWQTPVVFSNPYKRNNHTAIRTVTVMRASSDYSRRRPRKNAMSKTNHSVPKGFAAKPQVRKSIQKKGRDLEVEQSDTSPSSKNFSSPGQLSEATADGKGESRNFHSISTIMDNAVKSTTKSMEVGEESNLADGDVVKQVEETGTLKKEETVAYDFKDFEKSRMTGDESLKQNKLSEVSGYSGLTVSKTEGQIEKSIITEKHAAADCSMEVVTTTVGDNVNLGEHDGQNEQAKLLVKKNIEMEAQAHRNLLEGLAMENLASGSKFFVFPKVIIADHVIEVYFNRSLSLLMNESDIFIKGAFNNWRWKEFTEKMHRSDLQGDWWTCQMYVPKEAYEMNFVFFNGRKAFENNNQKNFSEPIHGDMDEYAFEDLLLEEEQKRLEKLAAKQAEKERQDKELHRRVEEQAAIEAVRAHAKLEAEKKQEACQRLLALAVESVDGLWNIEHYLLNGESRLRIYYNRSFRSLEHCSNIWIHGGYNKWIEGLSIVERLNKHEKKDGDWWYADVAVPDKALILDWVFADGPPQHAKVYDNNNYQDFHAIIKKFLSEETYWLEEEDRLFKKLWEERLLKEAISRQKAEKTTRLKAETKERTLKRFLLSQKNVVYTEPLFIHAGKRVRVLYNLSNTILNGKEEVWFNYSFNRWSHRIGQLPPQKMVPVGNGTHFQTFVKVPLDAYVMDFVFSEKENGGVYDNKNGMDYHIPVIGGIAKESPLHIVHVAVEMAPIAKVGGLGDVVTSLSRAVQDLGHKVDIILPKYDCLKLNHVKNFHHHTSFFWGRTVIKVWYGKVEGLCVYFLEPQNGMFWAGCIYGKNNDGDRFGFFCHAALEFLLQNGFQPDILHCHDWSSAPVTWLFKEHYQKIGLGRARVIFTIHNLEFGIHQIGKAMISTDKATTVSHTYSKEISRSSVISAYLYKFHGIVNGIDPDLWDPYNDDFIPVSYTSENVTVGKNAAKEALQQRLGLKRVDCPLIGIISRLTVQKGVDLIKHTIWQTLERSGQVVLLGSAPDPRIQNDFINLANRLHSTHYDHARLCLTYDEPLSRLIYAGADFILVPSIFEPCGLTQLVAMRYGSIPVVRKTGGLYDTVFDVDNDKERAESAGLEPNGYSFESADPKGVDYALNRAISAWYDKREWLKQLCKRVMEQDWSWNRPALDYIELYFASRKTK